MHIGFYCSILPSKGAATGIVTYVRIMRDALLAAGHRVSVVAENSILLGNDSVVSIPPEHGPSALKTRFDARLRPVLGDGAGTRRWIAHQIRYAHARDPFDILEIEESFGWFGLLNRRRDPLTIVRLHGPHRFGKDELEADAAAQRSTRRCAAEELALTRAAGITSPSARLLAAMTDACPIAHVPARAIPNPMSLGATATRWSREHADPRQILCVGRFDQRKGADLLLEAFAALGAQRPELRLVMAGPDLGVPLDGTVLRFADYAARVLPGGIRDRVSHLGTRSAAEIDVLRRASALTIVASRFENFPYAIAEAMAVGAPLVVSDSFGNAELVVDGETGRVVAVGDAGALAAGIGKALDDPDRTAAMAAASLERCASYLSPDRVATDTVDFYERVRATARV